MKFYFIKQQDQRDSGPTCIRMILRFYGYKCSIQFIRSLSKINTDGVSLLGMEEAAVKLNFETVRLKVLPDELKELTLPCILNWRHNHYVVLYGNTRNDFLIADPAKGLIKLSKTEFTELWYSRREFAGTCLVLTPKPGFNELLSAKQHKNSWRNKVVGYQEYRPLFFQLFLGFLLGSIFQLVTPFLTQCLVDRGIKAKDIHIVYVILIAQIMVSVGVTAIDFIRSWILLHIGSKINITLLADFLSKLMKLPINFFDTKTTGDIMQRMNDQQRVESFLTGSALNTFFSIFNLVIFSVVLLFYNVNIFLVFSLSTVLYGVWVMLFLKPKRNLNYIQFENASINQSNIIELISGIQDIKLNQSEQFKRWEWERLQVNLYRYKIKNLKLTQNQNAG